MKSRMFLVAALLFAFSNGFAQNFPIGIWFGGEQNAIDAVADMGFTWIQAYGGWDNDINNLVVQNTRNLNVIAIRERNINYPSFAQRMQYQAERTDNENGTRNYFMAHPTGEFDENLPDGWTARVSNPNYGAGFMVQSPDPDNQYFYRRRDWIATARMSIDGFTGNPNTQVARMEILDADSNLLAHRIITEGEFGGSQDFREFELAYILPFTPTPHAYPYPVTASLQEPELLLQQQDHGIDVRVWWYGQVNTYLDYVVLEDNVVDPNFSGAYQLFNGDRDADIDGDATLFVSEAAYPLLRRFYLRDEPRYNGYQPFNYVDQLILSANIEGSVNGRGRGITATPNYAQSDPNNIYAGFTRFMTDSRPFELMVDAYPIHADIPVNTSYIPASAADSTGIVPFNNDPAGYNALLQPAFDHMTNNIFLPAIQTANGSGVDWWYIAQVHGELDIATGQYRACDVGNSRMLRPPSPAELRAMVSLALAYGAKGIFYFAFPTWPATNFGECANVRFPGLVDEGSEFGTPDHSDNYDTINGINVFTGYQAKYEAVTAINSDLTIIGPELVNLSWQSARTSGESPGTSIVQNITGGDYIEIGDFIHLPSSEDYFMLVNRRCDDSDTQTITVTLASSGNRRLIEDVLASRVPWDGNANRVAYRTLEVGNNTFTVTLNPGEGRLFRVTSGLSGTLTVNRYWSGTPYVIDNLTVNNGVTLTVERATIVKFALSKKLTINGSIQAIGTSSQGITFDRVASTGIWSGIWIENSTVASNLNYCTARNATNAIRLRYTSGTVTIDHATLTNNTIGFVPEYSGPWTIQNSTLQNNSYGIYVNGFGGSGNLFVLSNLITQNSVHGVYLYNGVDAYLGFNTVTSNCTNTTQAGVFCKTNSDPYMRSAAPDPDYGNNYIHDNNGAGVRAESNSYPQLGRDYQYGTLKDYYGYNEIYENDGAEVYNGNISGTIVAERNYWSANHNEVPNPDFYDSVDYTPYLGGQPTGVANRFSSSDMIAQAIDFEDAFVLELQDQLQAAADLYMKLLESDPMADNAGFGISGLLRCYKGLGRWRDIVPLLDGFILKFPKTALAADAQDHSLPYLVSVGRIDDALAHALALLQQNRNVADKEPDYLFRTASLYILKSQGKAGDDLTNALSLYEELLQKYSNSDIAFLAQVEVEQLGVSRFAKTAPETSLLVSSSQTFTLYPNHPNPFNPDTQIKFFLEQEQFVALRIYDVCGRLVCNLLEGTYSQGEHVVSWNGRDERGTNVASGIYFYELLAGEQRLRMKMTLAR